MNDIAVFLEDIAANPHDDAPRLILADWIEENGDESLRPLGDFIRVQYALEGIHPGNPRRPGLLKLQQALLPGELRRWAAALSQLNEPRPQFRRGFIEHISLPVTALAWLHRQRTLGLPLRSLALTHATTARFDRRPKNYEALVGAASDPLLEQVEELSLTGAQLPPGVPTQAWMQSPRLGRLRKLTVGVWQEAAVEALLEGPLRTRVRSLELADRGFPYSAPGGGGDWSRAARLARGAPLTALESLRFPAGLPDRHFSDFLAAVEAPALTRVSLTPWPGGLGRALGRLPAALLSRAREVDLSGTGGQALHSLQELPHLESLSLSSCGLSADTIRLLAGVPAPLLWSLDLSTNRFGDEGARAVAALPMTRGLRSFRAGYCLISPLGAAALFRALPPSLTALDLSWNPIRGEGLAGLNAASLEALDASYCELGDDAAATIATWPAGKLNSLSLASGRLTDKGAAALLESPALAGLEALDLSTNSLTDATVDALLGSPLARQLRLVLLFGNSITPAAMSRLRAVVRGVVG